MKDEDWKAGDLALCIREGSKHCGKQFTVEAVVYGYDDAFDWVQGLQFREMPNPYARPETGWAAKFFIKITPLEEDGEDREIIDLYRKQKEPV